MRIKTISFYKFYLKLRITAEVEDRECFIYRLPVIHHCLIAPV